MTTLMCLSNLCVLVLLTKVASAMEELTHIPVQNILFDNIYMFLIPDCLPDIFESEMVIRTLFKYDMNFV